MHGGIDFDVWVFQKASKVYVLLYERKHHWHIGHALWYKLYCVIYYTFHCTVHWIEKCPKREHAMSSPYTWFIGKYGFDWWKKMFADDKQIEVSEETILK